MSDLLPCPFCGKEDGQQIELVVWCPNCDFGIDWMKWQHRASPWRSCKDDPPDDKRELLCYSRYEGGRVIGWMSPEKCWNDKDHGWEFHPTHWCELPALPEVSDE